MKNDLMVSLAINNSWDCPQALEETYFKSFDSAKTKGLELCGRYKADAFKIIKLTTGLGHYRTVGIFDTNGNYLR